MGNGGCCVVDHVRAILAVFNRHGGRANRARALRIERSAALAVPRPEFSMGDVVRHPLWGEGEVTNVAGDTVGAYFPGHGDKLLKAKFLEKVGEL